MAPNGPRRRYYCRISKEPDVASFETGRTNCCHCHNVPCDVRCVSCDKFFPAGSMQNHLHKNPNHKCEVASEEKRSPPKKRTREEDSTSKNKKSRNRNKKQRGQSKPREDKSRNSDEEDEEYTSEPSKENKARQSPPKYTRDASKNSDKELKNLKIKINKVERERDDIEQRYSDLQDEYDQLVSENKTQEEKIKRLEQENLKLKPVKDSRSDKNTIEQYKPIIRAKKLNLYVDSLSSVFLRARLKNFVSVEQYQNIIPIIEACHEDADLLFLTENLQDCLGMEISVGMKKWKEAHGLNLNTLIRKLSGSKPQIPYE